MIEIYIFLTQRYFVELYERRKTVLAYLAQRLCAFVFRIDVTIPKMSAGRKILISFH